METKVEAVGLEQLRTFGEGLDHPEGIAVTVDGTVYVGGEAGQIYRLNDDETVSQVGSTGGFCLGLAADGEGRLYVCDQFAGGVWRFNPASGTKEIFTKGLPERPITVPNWGCFDAFGNYYLTDSGTWGAEDGLVWIVRPRLGTEVWTEDTRGFPNGCAISADGRHVYVVESNPSAIVQIPINDEGRAGPKRVLAELGEIVPDGLAVCADDSLIIPCYRPDAIFRYSSATGLEVLAHDPKGIVLAAPTNIVFVGDRLDDFIVPNLGRWHLTRGRLGVSGLPLLYPTREQLGS